MYMIFVTQHIELGQFCQKFKIKSDISHMGVLLVNFGASIFNPLSTKYWLYIYHDLVIC